LNSWNELKGKHPASLAKTRTNASGVYQPLLASIMQNICKAFISKEK
jgi:FKBP-type peptidyl-prolyl cis-trans isomerase (trigger factor)